MVCGALAALALAACTSGSVPGDDEPDASVPSSFGGQSGTGVAGSGGPVAGGGGPVAGGGGPVAGSGGGMGGPAADAGGGPAGGAGGGSPRLDGGAATDTAPAAMPWGPLTYQAEDARSSTNARNLTARQGFTGRGYIEVTFFSTNTTVDFAIDTPGGSTEVEIRYITIAGFGGAQARTVNLSVGNTRLGMVSLPASTNAWAVGKVTVTLPAGRQTLRLTLPQGGLALDSITLRGSGQTQPPPPPPPPTDGGVAPPRMDTAAPAPMDTAPPPPPPEGCNAPAIVLTPNCALSGCHNGLTQPNLTASANLFNNLKAATSMNGCRGTPMVDTANPANSGIIRAIKGTCGTKMPVGAWRSGNEADAVTCLTKWIEAGGK